MATSNMNIARENTRGVFPTLEDTVAEVDSKVLVALVGWECFGQNGRTGGQIGESTLLAHHLVRTQFVSALLDARPGAGGHTNRRNGKPTARSFIWDPRLRRRTPPLVDLTHDDEDGEGDDQEFDDVVEKAP